MISEARARAEAEQLRASDPAVSAFVAASAGSGKTKLLTDRLLRLMLGGPAGAAVDPARIQCLTFTKAAAAEMALRLHALLGEWVTLGDAVLDTRLLGLELHPTDDLRRQARALFARVLDLPGGMRIGTIHAFCQSLLRRFPLEAALSPHFQVVEEADAAATLTEAREDMLAGAHSPAARAALDRLAGLATLDQFGRLVAALQSDRERLDAALAGGVEALAAAQRRVLGVTAPDAASLLAANVHWQEERELRRAALVVQRRGGKIPAEKAQAILDWLELDTVQRAEHWDQWRCVFFTRNGEPAADSRLVDNKLAQAAPELREPYLAEQARIAGLDDAGRAIDAAELSAALLRLAVPVAEAYARRKSVAHKLDYDDLIGRTVALMREPGAAWVLYKLDGGLDHLLLDEVQDTAPAQWRIADALTQEFFAGKGARDPERPRTIFAVGDRKQSIYSFQGADPDAFEHWRDVMARRTRDAGGHWVQSPLDVSFRSTAPVLHLVDAVFAQPLARPGVVGTGDDTLKHYPDRAGQAGCVELWPLLPAPDQQKPEPWTVPDDYHGQTSAPQRLADALARWIAEQIGSTRLESGDRPLHAGDVLILLRRRNEFARLLVRALKLRGVQVAGLDRLLLTAQPAVADLLTLCDTLLLPQDDLSLACVLTSPLGGLSDESLMPLAARREGTLWDALRRRAGERADWRQAAEFLSTLMARVDYATPHALLAEALGPLGGRARLLARLGPEAAEPIDELLGAALVYVRTHPPAMQGFLFWLRQSAAEVKREAEGVGDAVRIMTVHGAKGLQAPLVILPDTTALPPDERTLAWARDPAGGAAVPIWSQRRELRCSRSQAIRQEAEARRLEEYNRLLYVALTRAEDRLLVCGWAPRKGLPENCWYELVRRGFDALPDAQTVPFPGDWGETMRRLATPQSAPPDRRGGTAAGPATTRPPAWAGAAPDWRPAPPPEEPVPARPIAPSRPGDGVPGPVPQTALPLAVRDAGGRRFRRGRLLHALLQHLPALAAAEREAAALAFLARPGSGLAPGEAATLAGEALAILEAPEMAPLFGPESQAEVPLTGLVDGLVISGLVDRLAVLADRVLVADYKTDRTPPETVEATPIRYVRQMAAYRALLRVIFPGRAVTCFLVWSQAARIVGLPDALLDLHAPNA